jgi:chemotaxis protein CheC
MTPESRKVDEKLLAKMRIVASRGFSNSAQGLSKMIGQELSVFSPDVDLVPLSEIPKMLGGPDNDAVGVYLRIDGELTGQIMMVISYQQALEFCDMVLDSPSGTTKEFGRMERSALSEIGNLTGTFFLNAIYEITGLSSHPSPPAVMVDMVGSILDVVIATMGAISDQILMFKAAFRIGERKIQADFWIIPDPVTLEKLTVAEMNTL